MGIPKKKELIKDHESSKKALIVANLAGFAAFLIHDMQILINKGYHIIFAANANKIKWEDTKQKIDQLGVEFVQIDFDSRNPLAKANRLAYRQLKKIMSENCFEIIHCHTPISGMLTRFAARKYRRKGTTVIYTTHGFSFHKYSSKKSWIVFHTIEKFCSRLCDVIITINKEDYQCAKKMRCKNVFYINGVGVKTSVYKNVSIDKEEYKKQLGLPLDKTIVLSVGELSNRKNHRIIVKALSKIQNNGDFVFVVCGAGIEGGTGKMLTELAEKEGVDIRLLGFRHDIPNIISIADIGVLPSIREGLGLAGIEMLACGIPVIGSDVQGIRDYIIDGSTGYLCNPYDENQFAEKIILLSNKDKRKSMRKSCQEMAENFDISLSHQQMNAIYENVIDRKL